MNKLVKDSCPCIRRNKCYEKKKYDKVSSHNGELWGSEEKGEISMLIGVVRIGLIGKKIFEYRLKGVTGGKPKNI